MKIKSTAVFLAASVALLFSFSLHGSTSGRLPVSDPPVFTNAANVPDTLTVACLKDVPNGEKLEATDDNDPAFPQLISPVDNPLPGSINACTGGYFDRVWTATDLDGNVAGGWQWPVLQPLGGGLDRHAPLRKGSAIQSHAARRRRLAELELRDPPAL